MRKPRDIDAELKALQDRARELKLRRITQLGELVTATGADYLPLEALAGALLAAIEQAAQQPETLARWTQRGAAFFRAGQPRPGNRGKRNGAGQPAPEPANDGAPAAADSNPTS